MRQSLKIGRAAVVRAECVVSGCESAAAKASDTEGMSIHFKVYICRHSLWHCLPELSEGTETFWKPILRKGRPDSCVWSLPRGTAFDRPQREQRTATFNDTIIVHSSVQATGSSRSPRSLFCIRRSSARSSLTSQGNVVFINY